MKAFEFKPKLFTTLQNYSKESFMADLMAGIIVGIVALPLAIAFGIASGVSPEKGIITAIVAGFIISLLGYCIQTWFNLGADITDKLRLLLIVFIRYL